MINSLSILATVLTYRVVVDKTLAASSLIVHDPSLLVQVFLSSFGSLNGRKRRLKRLDGITETVFHRLLLTLFCEYTAPRRAKRRLEVVDSCVYIVSAITDVTRVSVLG